MVYPRPRGVSRAAREIPAGHTGLSPPARGIHRRQSVWHNGARSIPACAGDPSGCRPVWLPTAVYPRPRGGSACRAAFGALAAGLSPPARGIRVPRRVRGAGRRSIPARAGDPRAAPRSGRWPPVYPRPRGGSDRLAIYDPQREGLSPPARGIHEQGESRPNEGGSIPARAGDPRTAGLNTTPRTVYPRPCGGSLFGVGEHAPSVGLSPPARGICAPARHVYHVAGSIPARAGDPARRRPAS